MLLLGPLVLSVHQIGDAPANKCWAAINQKTDKVCLDDFKASVVVLLHSAAWCIPCKAEFKDLVPAVEKHAGQKIVFISLSSESWSHGGAVSVSFLKEWSVKFGIDKAKASWVVAAAPHDAGRDFFENSLIPNVVILGVDGKIVFKGIAPGVKVIEAQVATALKGVK